MVLICCYLMLGNICILFSSFTLTALLGQLLVIASQVPGSSQMKAREGES